MAQISAGRRSQLPFLTATSAFNFSFLSLAILLPIYLQRVGYSLTALGLILAIPGLMQLGLRLTSGVLADTWGAKRVMLLSFVATTIAALPLLWVSLGIFAIVVAQVFNGFARGAFWPPAQTFTTQFGDPSRSLGRFFSVASVGSIFALVVSGALAQHFGFDAAFLVSAFLGALSLVLWTRFPEPARSASKRLSARQLIRTMPAIARRRPLVLAGVIAFVCSTPNVLAATFFPILAVQLGFGVSLATAVVAMRSLGTIGGATSYSPLIERIDIRRVTTGAIIGIAVPLIAIPLLKTPQELVVDLLIVGICGQIANLSYLWLVTENSEPSERGTALSIAGLWWTVAVFIIPPAFGIVSDHLGVPPTFAVLGAFLGLLGLAAMTYFARSEKQHGSVWAAHT